MHSNNVLSRTFAPNKLIERHSTSLSRKKREIKLPRPGFFFALLFYPFYQNDWILRHSLLFFRVFCGVANQKQFVKIHVYFLFSLSVHASGLFTDSLTETVPLELAFAYSAKLILFWSNWLESNTSLPICSVRYRFVSNDGGFTNVLFVFCLSIFLRILDCFTINQGRSQGGRRRGQLRNLDNQNHCLCRSLGNFQTMILIVKFLQNCLHFWWFIVISVDSKFCTWIHYVERN